MRSSTSIASESVGLTQHGDCCQRVSKPSNVSTQNLVPFDMNHDFNGRTVKTRFPNTYMLQLSRQGEYWSGDSLEPFSQSLPAVSTETEVTSECILSGRRSLPSMRVQYLHLNVVLYNLPPTSDNLRGNLSTLTVDTYRSLFKFLAFHDLSSTVLFFRDPIEDLLSSSHRIATAWLINILQEHTHGAELAQVMEDGTTRFRFPAWGIRPALPTIFCVRTSEPRSQPAVTMDKRTSHSCNLSLNSLLQPI
ncbi:hypothetical protein BDR05DRAFT_725051 [Suillus weaverae]|nr:hypothetical protein BDR05DRAFT_725051 [Suillus weaverae]